KIQSRRAKLSTRKESIVRLGGIAMVKSEQKNREQYTNMKSEALHEERTEEFRDTFLELHPSDQVDIFITLDKALRKRCYEYLSPAEFAMIIEGMNIYDQQKHFQELNEQYSSEMFNNMFTDDVVYFLTGIDLNKSDDILNKMEQEKAEKVRILLSYAEETAGAIMTKELISISATEEASLVIEQLRKTAPNAEIIYYNYVIDESGKL